MNPSLSSSSPSAEPTVVSASVLDVLAVFHDSLAGVRFPDVDAAVLEADVRAVNDAAAAVAALEASLDVARRSLDDAHDGLVHRAAKAVAYARVFAIGDDTLMNRLDAIALPRPRGGATSALVAAEAPKRRGRKSTPPSETLFAGPVLVTHDAAAE
jgi:hypothetical protein